MRKLERNMTKDKAKEYIQEYKYIHALCGVHTNNYKRCFTSLTEFFNDFIFWPTIKKVKTFDRYERIAIVETQSLPNYAFLLLKNSQDEICNEMEVKGNTYHILLDNNKKPHYIPYNEFIYCVSKVSKVENEWETQIQKGDIIYLTGGPFKNFSGVAVKNQEGQNVKVEISNLFGRRTVCYFDLKNIRKGLQ